MLCFLTYVLLAKKFRTKAKKKNCIIKKNLVSALHPSQDLLFHYHVPSPILISSVNARSKALNIKKFYLET